MGTTISRPLFHTVESTLLALAYIVDTLVHFFERLVASAVHVCLVPAFPSECTHDRQRAGERRLLRRLSSSSAQSSSRADRPKRWIRPRKLWTIRKGDDRLEQRKRRAEWAAAGLDPGKMEQFMLEKKLQGKQRRPQSMAGSDTRPPTRVASPDVAALDVNGNGISDDHDLYDDANMIMPTIRPVPRASAPSPPLLVRPVARRAQVPTLPNTIAALPSQGKLVTPIERPKSQQQSQTNAQHLKDIFAHTRGASSLDLSGGSQPLSGPGMASAPSMGFGRAMTMPGLLLEDASAASNRLGMALLRGRTPPSFGGANTGTALSRPGTRPTTPSSMVAAASTSNMTAFTPTRVTDMVDLACKSRWEANARERKVWKGEVDRIALHRLNEQQQRPAAVFHPGMALSRSTTLASS